MAKETRQGGIDHRDRWEPPFCSGHLDAVEVMSARTLLEVSQVLMVGLDGGSVLRRSA